MGTAENDADRALCLLNELAGAYASRSHMPQERYTEALAAITAWAHGNPLRIPAFVLIDESPFEARVKTESDKMYALKKVDGGWMRGHQFGASISAAMRGAA